MTETNRVNSVTENILGTEKIGKLLFKFAVPGIISMVVNALYNIIDQIFIGQGVGYLGNGATTVIFPMTSLALAFSIMFGDGAASYMSLRLGEGKKDAAANGALAGAVGSVGSGLILTIIYLLFMEKFCLLFGASEAILPYAVEYGTIITLGIPFFSICGGFGGIIRADGSPRYNMVGLLVGCVFNLVFDPVFIFVFHWGVKGAALATIMGQIANALINVYYLWKKTKNIEIHVANFRDCLKALAPVASLGVSSFITQFTMVVAIAVRNNVLVTYGAASKYGADIPVTTVGVTMKTFNIIMSIVLGLNLGAQPILGYNYGAGKYDRVKSTFKLVLILSTAIATLGWVFAQFFPMQIISIFGSESQLYNEFAVMCMKIFLMFIPLFGINMAAGIFFQALGYPVQSAALSLGKQIVFQLPFTIILPMTMGVVGALWAGPVSDILSASLSIALYLIYRKKIFGIRAAS